MLEDEIRNWFEEESLLIVDNMFNTLYGSNTPDPVKVKIYEMIFDRLLGKPEETIHLDDKMSKTDEAEKMIAEIVKRIRGSAI